MGDYTWVEGEDIDIDSSLEDHYTHYTQELSSLEEWTTPVELSTPLLDERESPQKSIKNSSALQTESKQSPT